MITSKFMDVLSRRGCHQLILLLLLIMTLNSFYLMIDDDDVLQY